MLARTDWDVPKHDGLSFFIVEMRQAGIEIRPIHQITGDSHFNEMFLENAEEPVGNRIGAEGQGWKVMQSALVVERLFMGAGGSEKRMGVEQGISANLIELARDTGKLNYPVARQKVARELVWWQLNALNLSLARAEMEEGTPRRLCRRAAGDEPHSP